MEKLLLQVGEAADALGIGRTKAYELIRRGELPTVRVGGCLRIPVEGLRRRINKLSGRADAELTEAERS